MFRSNVTLDLIFRTGGGLGAGHRQDNWLDVSTQQWHVSSLYTLLDVVSSAHVARFHAQQLNCVLALPLTARG